MTSIVVTGHAGAGKSACAELVADQLHARHISVGDIVRAELETIADAATSAIDREDAIFQIVTLTRVGPVTASTIVAATGYGAAAWTFSAANRNPETRTALQALANDRSEIDPCYWATAALRQCKDELDAGHDIVVSGARRPQEADTFRRHGFTIVMLSATPEERKKRLSRRDGYTMSATQLADPSEQAIAHIHADLTIDTSTEAVELVAKLVVDRTQRTHATS